MRPAKVLAPLHAVPLIRRVRLGNKIGNAGRDFGIAPGLFLADFGNRFSHFDDTVQVDRALAGQSAHKVQFDAIKVSTERLATTFVLVASSLLVSLLRKVIPKQVRIASYIVIIATFVTVVDYVIQAISLDLYNALGAFIQLIVANCVILGRAEAFASRQRVGAALADGLGHGLGFATVLVLLGALREIIGQGTLFAGAGMLFGEAGAALELRVLPAGMSLPLAGLAPGAFIGLAGLLAVRNLLQQRHATKHAARSGDTGDAGDAG